MARQLGLLASTHSGFDGRFANIQRIELAHAAWLDYAQGWLGDHAELFERLLHDAAWQTSEQQLYDKTLTTPRLIAACPEQYPLTPLLASMQQALSARYGQKLERISLALYRDGRDSVAFHGDRIARELPHAIVATVSVGAPRRFQLRPRAGADAPGVARAFNLGWGDLLVMGGSCQRTWEHAVPKTRSAQPRIAIMFRPVWQPQR